MGANEGISLDTSPVVANVVGLSDGLSLTPSKGGSDTKETSLGLGVAGLNVGLSVGSVVGFSDGAAVGSVVGFGEGAAVGCAVCTSVGEAVFWSVGDDVGNSVGGAIGQYFRGGFPRSV